MGSTRFAMSAVQRIASLRVYSGTVSWYPAAEGPLTTCTGRECTQCAMPERDAALAAPPATDPASEWDANAVPVDAKLPLLEQMRGQSGPATPLLDALRAGNDAGWQHETSRTYVLLTAANVTHIASDSFVAPHAHWSDGSVDVLLVKEASRSMLLKLFLALDSGQHVGTEGVHYRKVRALRVQPEPLPAGVEAFLDVDGERMPVYGATELEVHRGLLNLVRL